MEISRRLFLKSSGLALGMTLSGCLRKAKKPNLLFVFADQWRAQATGYNGDPNVKSPHLDELAAQSINLSNAVSGCPVCSPYRASLITGQYPLTHGVFYNDKPLGNKAISFAQALKAAGYTTGYIGKWHIDGHGRDSFIPRERRQGFEFWKVRECTHDYNNSFYFGDTEEKLYWKGYDAIAQTKEAVNYIKTKAEGKQPFALFLSWGPPHAPYNTAPQKYRDLFPDPAKIILHPNVPDNLREKAQRDLAGYYAHIAALDDCLASLITTLDDLNLSENTILVFTSDHGDMLYSLGMRKKQKPWEESVRVPFLIRYPAKLGKEGRVIDMPINTPDIMPTILGLCGAEIPDTVEGTDYSDVLTGDKEPDNDAALISCPVPFHQWNYKNGGREYRGVRTRRYTYVRDLNGPWLLYDNEKDPYQLNNLVNTPEYADIQKQLEDKLEERLRKTNDPFLPGPELMKKYGWSFDPQDL